MRNKVILFIYVLLVIFFTSSSAAVSPQVSAGYFHTVGLKSDGTVVAVGDTYFDQCNVSGWSGITQVSAGLGHTVGLKSDGTVVAVGYTSFGQCDVSGWSGITQVSAGHNHTVGLKSDGTVVAVGINDYGQCDVSGWSGITQVSGGYRHTVGLKSDGTVVAVGSNSYGQCNVSGWSGITQVSAGRYHTMGLKSDGTVVAVGRNDYGQCDVSGWSGVTQVSAAGHNTVGLKSDGAVVAVGINYYGACNVSGWSGITQVSAGNWHTVGLKSDGTVVAVGDTYFDQCDVSGWNMISASDERIRIVSWNILNYPDLNGDPREEYYQRVLEGLSPDILIVQEMTSAFGVGEFLNNVMKPVSKEYRASKFFDGPDTDSVLFYDRTKIRVMSSQQIYTSLRDISEYSLKIKKNPGKGVKFKLYSVHFAEGLSPGAKTQREGDALTLRNYLDGFQPDDLFLVCGTFNMISSREKAFKVLTGESIDNIGRLQDPMNKTGKWHDKLKSRFTHSESTRKSKFGDGAKGGLDDRYDMILISYGWDQSGKLIYRPGSCIVYGNDGKHLNKAINAPKNKRVSSDIADALYHASDHLPVIIELVPPEKSMEKEGLK
jgi:endonuclease/exonuclease/phosphatase family metal-dependent hydrolase